MPRWHFYLLGPMEITLTGRPIPLPPHRTQSLLAALLLRPRPQRREQLVGLLLPDLPERSGRRRLSDYLYHLRQALPDLPLIATAEAIELPAASRWLDVEAFRQLAASKDLADWQAALALYRGMLLPTCFDDWLLIEREALHLEYMRLLYRTCVRLSEWQEYKAALPLAQRLVEEEPFDEVFLRLLMQTYAALGRRGAALAAFEQFSILAARELEIEPEAATETLAQAIRATSPFPSPALSPPSPAGASEATPKDILHQARLSLHRGEWSSVERCLEMLKTLPADDRVPICILESDLAILAGDYEQAASLLREFPTGDRSPAFLARKSTIVLAQGQRDEAHALASQALLLAHERQDHPRELEALLALAPAQSRLGEGSQVEVTLKRACTLASRLRSPSGLARTYLAQAKNFLRQGRYQDALATFYETQSLAQAHGLRPHLATALLGTASARFNMGVLLDVLPAAQRALSIRRDLGLRRKEARTLEWISIVFDTLGRYDEAVQANETARRIYEELGSALGVARSQYHLTASLLYRADSLAGRAITLAREALAVFRAHGQKGWVASTLATLGYALWVGGEGEPALDAFQQAYALHQRLGEMWPLPEIQAYQGLAHLELGHLTEALDCTQRALLALAQGTIENDIVSEIYYAHAVVLAAHGQEAQAHEYVVRAYENLLNYAAQLEDEQARQAFFHHNPTTRRLMAEVYARGIAPDPGQGVVVRQAPARSGRGTVPVRWTLDAGPPDTALKWAQGAIALRRSRLARLLRESAAQGARPTVQQLADLLGVSPRTIKRDLAALRQE